METITENKKHYILTFPYKNNIYIYENNFKKHTKDYINMPLIFKSTHNFKSLLNKQEKNKLINLCLKNGIFINLDNKKIYLNLNEFKKEDFKFSEIQIFEN